MPPEFRSPVIIGPVAPVVPVVPVVAVLLVGPFSRGAVAAVTARAAVRVSVRPSVPIVVLVAIVRVVPLALPRLVAVAWVVVFTLPLPLSSICNDGGGEKKR